ncbi:tyrosine-type recombinase/integrase [Streptococcus parasanguinis]|uniref:Tyrosine-type recombinase/integrase n=2 Tax=Streptococcus parasanguinis TaxID=1318 RepID=A0A6L6LG27_STRPA|nr:tyrosine-type recombinase/integrase [Bifidobacterium longum]MTR63725.1 tyrosine-type recombinase/integrase [Streptococcus parasanguinis]MTR65683.1 tyrosine-type recombinase/integrase [Streptococcus parasanguinis]MTR69445.1 tyrosine-type recombinase/integrase [Streptococcus parasanguinis]MTS05979.1 tyrosine-type recombinase/integrase [Streptococcus parasanguinis]
MHSIQSCTCPTLGGRPLRFEQPVLRGTISYKLNLKGVNMTSNETKKKEGRWALKRRLKREREQAGQSYRRTARLRLQEMFKAGFGNKRSSDKTDADTQNKIYSKNTFETYKRQFSYFADWLAEAHKEAYTLSDARQYVDEYLLHLIELGRSAYSITTAKAALAKVFQTEATQFIETPPRERANIKRSRGVAVRDSNISNKTETKLALFSSAVGLRRKEMMSIESKDLFFDNGKAYLNVTKGTKGGKPRIVEICGISEGETKMIVEWIQSREGKLFPKLNTNYDNHHYRAVYAQRLYDRYKREERDIPPKERYIMRKERAGEVYDKSAMKVVSENLGHNRISVIAQSYLYN